MFQDMAACFMSLNAYVYNTRKSPFRVPMHPTHMKHTVHVCISMLEDINSGSRCHTDAILYC
jgi:hypothetical protein